MNRITALKMLVLCATSLNVIAAELPGRFSVLAAGAKADDATDDTRS